MDILTAQAMDKDRAIIDEFEELTDSHEELTLLKDFFAEHVPCVSVEELEYCRLIGSSTDQNSVVERVCH